MLILLLLLVLARQAWQSLNALSGQAALASRIILTDARRNETTTNVALEMERSYRQYYVLDDPTFTRVYQSQHKCYSEMLDAHVGVLSDDRLYQALRQDLNNLAQPQYNNGDPSVAIATHLEAFTSASAEMVWAAHTMVFFCGQQLQHEVAEREQYFGWQSLVLFLMSPVMVLFPTRIAIDPMKDIEHTISRLGEGRSLDNNVSPNRSSELRSVEQHVLWLSECLSWLESQRHQSLRHLSHGLETPLASMREGTELLAGRVAGPSTPEQKEVVSILDNSSRNLQKSIEQLLDYSHKQADSAVGLEDVELAPLMETVVSAHSLPARARMMHAGVDLEVTTCLAKSVLLVSVLSNPYSNTVHHGAESGNICFHSSLHDARVCIDVISTDTPIPQEEHAIVLEPLFQGNHQQKGAVKGGGLGLGIARDCIRRMQGELYLVDKSG